LFTEFRLLTSFLSVVSTAIVGLKLRGLIQG